MNEVNDITLITKLRQTSGDVADLLDYLSPDRLHNMNYEQLGRTAEILRDIFNTIEPIMYDVEDIACEVRINEEEKECQN